MPFGRPAATVTALLIAFIAAGMSFGLVEVIALYLLRWIFEIPGDPSTGDSAGWGFIISQPVTIILGVAASVGVGGMAFGAVFQRLRK